MIINILDKDTFLSNNAWSIQFFLPKEELIISDDYRFVQLKDIVCERKGYTSFVTVECDVNYIGLENIESKTGRLIGFEPKLSSDIKSASKIFCKGDILFGRVRPNLNKVFYNDVIEQGVCSTEILVLIPNKEIVNAQYLAAILRTEIVNQRVVGLIKGAALPRVGIQDLLQMEIPLPSLRIQDGIAVKLEKQYAELEKCYKLIADIPMQIDEMISGDFLK